MELDLLAHPALLHFVLTQAGAFARWQVRPHGITDHHLHRALKTGSIRQVADGVYVVSAVAPSFLQSLWIARLAIQGGCAVSHEAAGRLHEFATLASFSTATLLAPNGCHERMPDVVVHQTRDAWPVSIALIDGLPVTTPERTVVDLAAIFRSGRLAIVLDDAVAAKRTTYTAVGTELQSVARRGKPGVRLLGGLLDARGPGVVPPYSQLERDLMALFDRFGGPRPKLAWPYPGRQQINGCADAGFADALLALEADGRRWHDRIAQRKVDIDRDNEAGRHGVQVMRLLHEHIVGDPRGTWQLIQDTRRMRLGQLGDPVLQVSVSPTASLRPAERGRLSA